MSRARTVASQALAILAEVYPHEGKLKKDAIKKRFNVSERVARVVNQVTRGKLDIEIVRDEAQGELPAGTVSPQNNASGGANADAVPGEGPSDSGAMTPIEGGGYLFEWRDATGPRSLQFSEARWAQIVRDYVDPHEGGSGLSMHQLAVKHGLTRRDFQKVKSLYGLTKQHEPFTRAHMEASDVLALADEQLAVKRQQLAMKVEKESLADLRRYASKWLALQDGVLDPFKDIVVDLLGYEPPAEPQLPIRPYAQLGRRWIAFYQASDLHYGLKVDARLSHADVRYNRRIAKDRFFQGLVQAMQGYPADYDLENLDYVLLAVGGDVAHVDNIHALTSSMRHHQDMDGLPQTLFEDLVKLIYVPAVDWLLAQGHKVHLEDIPGNHDELISRALIVALWAAYKDDPRVTFGNMTASHAFHLYGNTLLVGHHGHGESKAKSLAATADVWLREKDEKARYRYALTGNLHHFDVEEEGGMILIQQPSPAESDVYHAQNGYDTSRSATLAAYFSPTDGLLSLRYIGF